MITWLPTKSPIRMLDARISLEVETHLRANVGIDAALLAIDLRMCPTHVEACQRKLGLRKCAPAGSQYYRNRGEPKDAI